MNQIVNPYISKNTAMSHIVGGVVNKVEEKPTTPIATDYIPLARPYQPKYGVYNNPLLSVSKPQAKPWRRIVREIEHALSSHDTRVWLNDKELTGQLNQAQILNSLYGVKTVIIQIARNDSVISRLYCTLGNSMFSLIGENRYFPSVPNTIRFFNFHEFIMKELKLGTAEARSICVDFIHGVTGSNAT